MKILKKIFSIFLRITVSIVFLFFLFRQVDFKNVLSIIKNSNCFVLSLIFLISILVNFLCFLRWKIVLKSFDLQIPIKFLISSFCGALFFNTFLPTSIGGDFMRTVDLSLYTKRPGDVVASVFLDRLNGYIGMVFILILAVALGNYVKLDPVFLYVVISIVVFLVFVLFILFNSKVYKLLNSLLYSPKAGKIRSILHEIHERMYHFKNRKKDFLYTVVISFFIQLLVPVSAFFIMLSIGVKISIIYFIIFVPLVSLIMLLPISLGGWGVREASFVFFMTKIGVDKNLALAGVLIGSVLTLAVSAIAGLIYVFTLHNRRLQSD